MRFHKAHRKGDARSLVPCAGSVVQCNGGAVPLEGESADTDKYQRDIVIGAKSECASIKHHACCGSASRTSRCPSASMKEGGEAHVAL